MQTTAFSGERLLALNKHSSWALLAGEVRWIEKKVSLGREVQEVVDRGSSVPPAAGPLHVWLWPAFRPELITLMVLTQASHPSPALRFCIPAAKI